MNRQQVSWLCGLLLVLATAWSIQADNPGSSKEALTLTTGQKDFLSLEPILVKVSLAGKGPGLPASPGKDLRLEVKPAAKPRPGAKPLILEAKVADGKAHTRLIDLLEWFQFKDGETYTVHAVLENQGSVQTSAPITFTIRRPDKKDSEWGPVDRLHHMPWSNYVTDAFCGDTFDVVKRWPESKLAKYCHYWNGLHHQHKKEYDKAIVSFQTLVAKNPDFILAEYANFGIAECLLAQNKTAEARSQAREILKRRTSGAGMTTVQSLALSLQP